MTLEELTELEEHLIEENNFNTAVSFYKYCVSTYCVQLNRVYFLKVTELSKIGGNSTYDFVRRCLTLIITNELAEEYSWHGLRKKREFGKLKLANVMISK